MEPRGPCTTKREPTPNGYGDVPDRPLNSVFLTMEEGAFAGFRQRIARSNPEARRLFAKAHVGGRTCEDGVIQLFCRWRDWLWDERDPVVAAFEEGLSETGVPYQFVRLGEEFGQVVHRYENDFDCTGLDGFRIVQTTAW